jgi:hypothetical protein
MTEFTHPILEQTNLVLPGAAVLGHLAVHDGPSAESLSQEVEQIFTEGNLLVRGLDAPALDRDETGAFSLKYDTIDRETDDMFERGDAHGLWYASSTLLLPGKTIPTYKNFGFMFNGATSEIHHVSNQDSGSSGQGDRFRAAESTLTSLADLAAVVTNKSPRMNEVNATFQSTDLKGIFALEAPNPTAKLHAWFMRQHMKDTTGIEYPLYAYDVGAGEIKAWQPTAEDVKDILNVVITSKPMRAIYAREYDTLVSK